MRNRLAGSKVSAVLFACFMAFAALGPAHAAGDWEWTQGQGWIQGAGVARPTPKEQLHYAYELEQKGEFMDAARQYFLLVQNFPNSEEAGVGLQRLARCLFEMENYYTSYKAIEQVIETYPNTGRMADLVEIELRIAKKLMVSETPDILSGRDDNIRQHNIRRSLEIIDSVLEHDPYGPVAAESYLVKGEGHLFLNEVQAARAAFVTIRDEFPRSDYLERARLGILQCDSLMGQANPRELQEQIEVVREAERQRGPRDGDDMDEFDDVESSIRQLSEVEAAKMMEQAEQYRRMGTRAAVKSSEFLYKEVVRRYPGTPQAEEAMERVGSIRIPKEQSRFTKVVKGINLNPFTYNRDPEPPWIVPQLKADDMVMVDSGLGPISGVPETGVPDTSYSPTIRPAGLKEAEASVGFSPAPEFVDGAAGDRTYSSEPRYAGGQPASGGGYGQQPPPRALPNAPDADLILPPGTVNPLAAAGYDNYSDPYQSGGYSGGSGQQRQYFDPNTPNPSLGAPEYHTPYSDLVDMPGGSAYGGGYSSSPYGGTPTPAPTFVDGGGYGGGQQSFSAPTPPRPVGGSGGGWSFDDDFR